MRSHSFSLITFFSIVIILCALPLILLGNSIGEKNIQKNSVSLAPIPSEVKRNLQIIHQASASGAVICTKEDPSICKSSQEGKVLEYNVGCNGSSSASSVYICKKGRWIYINWTPNGYCHFCARKSLQK